MLGAIISDTELFKSPTTAQEDRDTAANLAKLSGIGDISAFCAQLLEARSDMSGLSAMELVLQDFKTFDLSGRKVGVAQLELSDISLVSSRWAELLAALNAIKGTSYHTVLLMLTDIMKEGTDLLVLSEDIHNVEAALGMKIPGNRIWLPGVVSRKSQIIPGLLKAFRDAA